MNYKYSSILRCINKVYALIIHSLESYSRRVTQVSPWSVLRLTKRTHFSLSKYDISSGAAWLKAIIDASLMYSIYLLAKYSASVISCKTPWSSYRPYSNMPKVAIMATLPARWCLLMATSTIPGFGSECKTLFRKYVPFDPSIT